MRKIKLNVNRPFFNVDKTLRCYRCYARHFKNKNETKFCYWQEESTDGCPFHIYYDPNTIRDTPFDNINREVYTQEVYNK